jgi:hypothetical protein
MTNESNNTNPVEKTKPRRWFRFRLRTLLVMVTLLSVPLGWAGWELDQRRREKATIAWVEEMGGYVGSPWPNDQRSWWAKTEDKWLGESVRYVNLIQTPVNDLSPLLELTNLESLDLSGIEVNVPLLLDLSPIAEMKKLKELRLINTPVSELSPLAELKNLETLAGFSWWVNEEQVEKLRKALPNCEIDWIISEGRPNASGRAEEP